jgi:hypothetical protein
MPATLRFIALPAALLLSKAALAAGCDLDAISAALDASLEGMKPYEREAVETQSTEGGGWQVFREKDGRLNTVVRSDFGESGRNDTRLSAVNRETWGISATRTDYNRHAFAEDGGPFAVVRKTTVYYFFCGGKLYTPPPEWSTTGEDYAVEAGKAKEAFFKATEISEFVKGLTR